MTIQRYIAPRIYHPTEVTELVNEAYWNGLQARHQIGIQTHRLAQLIRDILRTAAISPTSHLESHLLELAQHEAGERDLKVLAAEITKRYDVLTSMFTDATGTQLSTYDQTMHNDAKTVREAVLMLSRGDSSMILRQDVLDIAGSVIRWQTPDVGRPEGMSESTKWICERLLHYRKQNPRKWWLSALELYLEIRNTPGDDWTAGHSQAYETLRTYFDEHNRVTDKTSVTKYCSKLVERYTAIYGKD